MSDHTYDFSGLRSLGGDFSQWGAAALHEHILDEDVTDEGKARAAAELERRQSNRERDRSWL